MKLIIFLSRFVSESDVQLLAPNVTPKGDRDIFNKNFKYYLEANCFLSPNGKMLTFNNIDKNGYMQYQIEKHECKSICRSKRKSWVTIY